MPVEVLLANAVLTDGRRGGVAVSGGRVVGDTEGAGTVVDLEGRLLLPAPAEPHAHLDKAFTADLFPNPAGDLLSAIEIIRAGWPAVDRADIERRAERGLRRLLVAGVTAVRSHADLNVESGLKSVEALVALRDRWKDLIDLQVAGLAGPLTGRDGPAGRSLLSEGIEAGIDVVGSCPHVEDDPVGTIEVTLAAAKEAGLPADLHFDEVLDVTVQHLPRLAEAVERLGLGGRVTASHCVSHGLLDPREQRKTAAMLASAGVAVITNPRTNLFLQARGQDQAPSRGIAGVRCLMEEGVLVAAGADNVQDPFYTIGRSDPLETASFLVAAAHRTVDEAWLMVSSSARAVMGVATPSYQPGAPADFVAVRAGSVREAIAEQPADRMVFRGGRLVARVTVDEWIGDG